MANGSVNFRTDPGICEQTREFRKIPENSGVYFEKAKLHKARLVGYHAFAVKWRGKPETKLTPPAMNTPNRQFGALLRIRSSDPWVFLQKDFLL